MSVNIVRENFLLVMVLGVMFVLIGEVLGIDNTVHFPFSKSGSVWNGIEIFMYTWGRQQSKPDASVFHEDERREGRRKVELKLKGFECLPVWEREYSLCRVCLCLTQSHSVDLSWRNAHRIKSKWFKCKATASGTGKIDGNRVDKRGESGGKKPPRDAEKLEKRRQNVNCWIV